MRRVTKEKNIKAKSSRVQTKITQETQNQVKFKSKSQAIFKKILKPISEVTQEHNTLYVNDKMTQHHYPIHQNVQQGIGKKNQQNESIFCKALICLKKCFGCWVWNDHEIIVKEQDIMKTISQLRKNTSHYSSKIPPPENVTKKTLVLDLEGTLLSLSTSPFLDENFSFDYESKLKKIEIHGITRFGLDSFLYQASKLFQIIVYSSANERLVKSILQQIDRKKRVSHVLSLDSCITINKSYHLKSLSIIGRDPQKVIIMDHKSISGILHRQNFLQISQFNGDKKDRELIKLIPFLREISKCEDILPIFKRYQSFKNKQIRIDICQQNKMEEQNSLASLSTEFQEKRRFHEKKMMQKKRKSWHRRSESNKVLIPTCSEEDSNEGSTQLCYKKNNKHQQ